MHITILPNKQLVKLFLTTSNTEKKTVKIHQ